MNILSMIWGVAAGGIVSAFGGESPNPKPFTHTDKVVAGWVIVVVASILIVGNIWWRWSYRRWEARKDLPPTHEGR